MTPELVKEKNTQQLFTTAVLEAKPKFGKIKVK